MQSETPESYGSRSFHLMMLMSQSIGLGAATTIPNSALRSGALGYMIWHVLSNILLGIPLVYMELIIGQFTGLNALEVWKVRPFLSHVGHILIFWQFFILFVNHIVTSFVLHYMFISFERPPPYYTCGQWANKSCNIITTNFTLSQDCLKLNTKVPYCKNLELTFPEVQYYRSIAGYQLQGIHVEWHMFLPSAIACLLMYLSCFKRRRSMEWFLIFFTYYPAFTFIFLLVGSLLQKGILVHYGDAMDIDFDVYLAKFDVPNVEQMMIYTLAAGTGLINNDGASCPFRAPCYANAVITVTINIVFHVLIVCTSAMMCCPYAFVHRMSVDRVINLPIDFLFEKLPAMFQDYDHNTFWANVTFSSYACLGVRTTIIIYYNLLEVFVRRFSTVAKYPGLYTFGAAVILFLITIPFLGNMMSYWTSRTCTRCSQLVSLVVVVLEYFVFIVCYGLDRFCEDVHFMQGIRPNNYMKCAWTASSILLLYVSGCELYEIINYTDRLEYTIGIWVFVVTMVYLVGMAVVKVCVSWCRNELRSAVRLSATWKPRSELLQRSRAMFTAQAMTKEYLYRQYHLQAGIQARQQRANPARANNALLGMV